MICPYSGHALDRSGTVLGLLNYQDYQRLISDKAGRVDRKRTRPRPRTMKGIEEVLRRLRLLSAFAPAPDLVADLHLPIACGFGGDGSTMVLELIGLPKSKARALLGGW
jgi:hypothetical protein